MRHSTKSGTKTVIVLGWAVLGSAAYGQAQVPQDPYPSFGQVPQARVAMAPRPDNQPSPYAPAPQVQGPTLPNFSQSAPEDQFGTRSARLERIAQDADRHTKKAFELASRGAYFSARAEFVRALRLLAQGLDSERQCRAYSQSLKAGLTAIEEVDDFIPTGSQLESDLPLREIIARHQTSILKDTLTQEDFQLPTPLEAVGAYLRYAQEQLSIATGGEVAGSMALHGLGKLYVTKKGTELDISLSRAIVCFKSSITTCPQNYLARNDLGVLLARTGRTQDARRVFEESLTVHPHPTTLGNLAAVYNVLGEKALLAQTKQCLANYKKTGTIKPSNLPSVDWVSPEQFSESYAQTPDAHQLPPAREANDTTAKPPVEEANRSWPWNWLKR